MSSPPRIDLSNFLNDEHEDSKYVLTSPRSLQACKKIGIRPNELLPRALAQVEADINKHYNSQGGSEDLPTREDCSGGKGEVTSETCYAVWEQLERERCEKLEQTRRERDQIIIEAYHDKKKKEGKGGKKSNSSTPRKREERHAPLRSESNPDLSASDVADSAQLDTRSLLVRPSSAQRHWSSVSHKQTLRTPQAKRDRLSAFVPRSEKRVVKSMLERSLEEEYSHSLRSYWDSLWQREQAETNLDRIRQEDDHRQHLSSVHSWYERERHLSRLDRNEEEKGRREERERWLRESEDRHRSALAINSRQKRQEAELARLDRGVKKRLQEQRLRGSQLQCGKKQESLGACLDQSSLRAEESKQSCVREQVQRSGYKNALWAAKSRRAQQQAVESADRDRGWSKAVLEDKLASADLRKLMQGSVSQSEREESQEREYLKRFQQQLSLRQQQSDREEWVQQEEEKRRERELWAEKRVMEGLLSRSRTTSEKRRSRTRSQQGNIAQVREDELVWRSLVAQDLEEKEERVNQQISARSLVAKENREIANITELLRDSIKERSGRKGFQDMVKSTEQFHRLGYGPRGFQKNVSYSHLIS